MDISNIEISFELGSAIVVTVSLAGLLAYFNRDKLAQFIKGTAVKIRIPFIGIEVEVEKLLELRRKMEHAGIREVSEGDADSSKQLLPESVDLSARDIVLESWGSLKQIVYDAAAHQKIDLTPATKTPEAVDRLVREKKIPEDAAEAIISLYDEGKNVADSPGKLNRAYASLYRELSESLVDWIMDNVIITKRPKKADIVPSRITTVSRDDSNFPPPRAGHAAATLVGLTGPMQGQHFPVDREIYRIGADSANHLPIRHDKFVSGKHAYLVYKTGNLFLYDQHSRNGTFLNNNRLKSGVPLTIYPGDIVKVGNSEFRVSDVRG
jgi:hypothetical protein